MVDAHQHLLQVARHDYFWLERGSAIDQDYGLEDLRAQLGEVSATVLVQAAPSERETQDLLEAAAASGGLVRAVVGWIDLASPAAPDAIGPLAARPLCTYPNYPQYVSGDPKASSSFTCKSLH